MSGRRAGLRAARRGVRSPARGVTGGGGGGAALAAATPPPGSADDTRPRPGTHRAHTLSKQCSEAPGGVAGGSATDGEAGRARPRGEPATLSPNSASFCLANVAAEGSLRGALRSPGGRSPVGVPRVTGGRSGRVERRDRVRSGLSRRWRRRAWRTREPEGCFQFIRELRSGKRGNFPWSSGGETDSCTGLAGPAAPFGARLKSFGVASVGTSFLSQQYCQGSGGRQAAWAAATRTPGVMGWAPGSQLPFMQHRVRCQAPSLQRD